MPGWVRDKYPEKQAKVRGKTKEISSWKPRRKDLKKKNHEWCPVPSENIK